MGGIGPPDISPHRKVQVRDHTQYEIDTHEIILMWRVEALIKWYIEIYYFIHNLHASHEKEQLNNLYVDNV